jgi:Tol biopolymer transport system component
MSVTTTRPEADSAGADELLTLDALIEEARRRARRRRRRYGAAVLAAAAVAVGAYAGFGRGGGAEVTRPTQQPDLQPSFVGSLNRAALSAGQLTVIGLPAGRSRYGSTPGYYDLSIVDAAGRLHPVVHCPDGREWCGWVDSFDWSPDGRRLAFSVTSYGSVNPYNGLHVLDLHTGADRMLRDNCTFGWVFDLEWSPDSNRIAAVCSRWGGPRGKILIVDMDGSARVLRTGTAGSDSSPSWSPTGFSLVFATHAAGRSWISVIEANGSGRRTLASAATAPDWSPDGERIVYRAGCGGVRLVSPAGADRTPFRGPWSCQAIGVPGVPAWLPDGRQIAISNGNGIYLVGPSGDGFRQVSRHRTRGVPGHGRPAWRPRPGVP